MSVRANEAPSSDPEFPELLETFKSPFSQFIGLEMMQPTRGNWVWT